MLVALAKDSKNSFELEDSFACFAPHEALQFAPHEAVELIARGKLTFDKRVKVHRVVNARKMFGGSGRAELAGGQPRSSRFRHP